MSTHSAGTIDSLDHAMDEASGSRPSARQFQSRYVKSHSSWRAAGVRYPAMTERVSGSLVCSVPARRSTVAPAHRRSYIPSVYAWQRTRKCRPPSRQTRFVSSVEHGSITLSPAALLLGGRHCHSAFSDQILSMIRAIDGAGIPNSSRVYDHQTVGKT